MELWLVRHGDTIVGDDGLYQPHHGLTEIGFQQARSVAGALVDVDFDARYTSNLPRAIQTAQAYVDLTSHRFTRIADLNEIDVGRIQDASVDFKHRVVTHQVELDFSQFGGENPNQFSNRVQQGFHQLLEDAKSKNCDRVVGFLHAGTIGAILDYMAGREFDYRSRPRMPNCAYTIVSQTSNGGWTEWERWHSDHLTTLT